MRKLLFVVLALQAVLTTAYAASQQQCETLSKPIEAKMAGMQDTENSKPTPQACARVAEIIKLYGSYQAQADKLNCPFAYVSGQQVGGAAERAELIGDIKKAYSEKCR